jgi:nitrite reductase (NADH) large subunit
MTQYVIIGTGPAGLSAAREILSNDPNGHITVISEESCRSYSKPALSHYLSGEITRKQLLETGSRLSLDSDRIKYCLNREVTGIDAAKQSVEFTSGTGISYDRLLIATGARTKIPPIPGLNPELVRPFMTLADADAIDKCIHPGKSALVIGGGLIGLKAAEALHHRGMSVIVVEILSWVMPSVLDSGAGNKLVTYLKNQGLDIRNETLVKELELKPNGSGNAFLNDGATVNFALAVLATGVEPRTFVKEVPRLQLHQGIVVDRFGKTNLKNIFAAGDVAEAFDPLKCDLSTNLNWTSAREQGRVAGRTMAGISDDYPGSVSLNSLTFFGCPIITMGIAALSSPIDEKQYQEIIDPTRRSGVYRKLVLQDGKVVGAILFGDLSFSGTYHRLIRDKVDVGDLGIELLTGGYHFIQLIESLRREDMEGDYSWRSHVWEETPYKKKLNTHKWQRRTQQ